MMDNELLNKIIVELPDTILLQEIISENKELKSCIEKIEIDEYSV